jgi:ATP-dependent DNA ligase
MERMDLPVMPPVSPMLARLVTEIPDTGHVEPKWDGFRTIVFRDGDEVVLGSRNERPMTRYFPEVVETIKANTPPRCVLDGELIVVQDQQLAFEALQLRIHPAASRVALLAEQTPASFVGFDLLALADENLMAQPFSRRRARLVEVLADARAPVFCTPATGDLELAREWFGVFEGAGLDGVVAKPLDGVYLPDKRTMFKVKHERTADCVVAGFRWYKSAPVVGSLLLGLFDDTGGMQHVGVAASFSMARRRTLLDELEPYRTEDLAAHPWGAWAQEQAHASGRLPGATSRWNAGKDLSWVPLRPELVCEVAYERMEGTRFRHTTRFRRWRPDRDPAGCDFDQLERPVRYRLADVLGGPTGA